MKKIPTDLEILQEIYESYYDAYRTYARRDPDNITTLRVLVNLNKVARACGVEEDMIFGRIYYHFNKKYSYKNKKGEIVSFFSTPKYDRLGVNFPLLAAILADLKAEQEKRDESISLAVFAIILSVVAVLLTILL